jgi:polysaccharide deacetylase 2 family uncharacterized protein YibQ
VQGSSIDDWLQRARQDGHETLLSVPMEPLDFPRNDPGPGTLLTSLPNSDNIGRLMDFLGVGKGYVGIMSLSGSRFLSDPQKVEPVLNVLQRRGLLVLDTNVTSYSAIIDRAEEEHVPFAVSSLVIDQTPSPQAINEALARIEKTARRNGSAVALASPLPLTLEILQSWIEKLSERGFALAPLSAVVK